LEKSCEDNRWQVSAGTDKLNCLRVGLLAVCLILAECIVFCKNTK
jgi:hypothetical protein